MVVVVHGAMLTRYSLGTLVKAIATQGAVVYNVDVKHAVPHLTSAVERIACAVRYARDTAAGYGGDPGWITLVGHSAGGYGAAVIALAGDDFGGSCAVTDVSTLVDALVTYEGVFDMTTHVYQSTFDFTAIKNEDPELWQALNPHSHVGRNPDLQVRLIHGDARDYAWSDTPLEVAVEFHQALAESGYDVELTVVEGAPHSIGSDARAVMVEQVMELARTRTALAPPISPEFPTGTFFHEHEPGNFCVYRFNEDGTLGYFLRAPSADVGDIRPYITGTYTIDGNLYTETSSSFYGCEWPATYAWTFDGQILAFQVVGEDKCSGRQQTLETPEKWIKAQ